MKSSTPSKTTATTTQKTTGAGTKLPFKLKRKPAEETFDRDNCCVQRCGYPATVVDATHNFYPEELPLCDRHWTQRCTLKCPSVSKNESERERKVRSAS